MSAHVMQIFMWSGALERASPFCDRCEFPAPTGMIECFWGCGLLPLQLSTGLSSSAEPGHCPPLPLRDPAIENA